jgi:hypothetical protein
MTAAHQKVAVLKNLNKCTMHNVRLILWSPDVSNTLLCLPLILNYILNTLIAFVRLVLLHRRRRNHITSKKATVRLVNHGNNALCNLRLFVLASLLALGPICLHQVIRPQVACVGFWTFLPLPSKTSNRRGTRMASEVEDEASWDLRICSHSWTNLPRAIGRRANAFQHDRIDDDCARGSRWLWKGLEFSFLS